MPQFDTTRRVAHSADDMFALVADIERYPEFVPLCLSLDVRSSRKKGERTILVADMSAGYKSIRETFTCQVILNPKEHVIDVSYIDGPFKYLANNWRFEPEGELGCLVQFSIDYEFKSRALGLLMGSMFDKAFRQVTTAFERRADELYGAVPS